MPSTHLIFVLELLSASLPSTSSHQVGIIWPVGYWEADRRHYITPSTKQSADVMLLRKTDFCAYFTITMADVCSSSCNSRHVDNHVYVLIPDCHLILSKIKAESMYHGVSFFTIYKNKNFIWQHVVWLLVCFCNCGSFYLERMCIFYRELNSFFVVSCKLLRYMYWSWQKKLQNLC